METRKLYYEDSHTEHFTARVLSCEPEAGRYAVTLDATAFYPEGGGQAADTGTLGGVRVLDTRDFGGTVVHFCAEPLAPGSTVEGRIDYEDRFYRMQQHSGEHIVSGILHRLFGCGNTGFHMGADRTTIDFDAVIPQEALRDVEREANEAVWRDLPVKVWTPSPGELSTLVYRTKKALEWPVRIVEFPGLDRCACCGTHVARTGEIGLIRLFSAVPFRGGTRIEMTCGKAALGFLNQVYEQALSVSHTCSVPVTQIGAGAGALAAQLAEAKFELVRLQRRRFARAARELAGRGNVLLIAEGLDSAGVRELAEAVSASCGGIAAVFSGAGEKGFSYCLAASEGDLRPLGEELNAALNGRGGGRPTFRQGSAKADAQDIRGFFACRPFTESSNIL